MYIEYVTPQRSADPRFTKDESIGGTFRPNWLIRTSDWKKVRGTEAKDGYCTLSYCWGQSGEMVPKNDGTNEYDLVDNGLHRVTKREGEEVISENVTFEGVLQQICKDFGVDYLWYDKICINQEDKSEKHGEIKQMHMIYSNARFTVAFVPDIEIINVAKFDTIDWVSGNPLSKDSVFYQIRTSLWWKRSWTLEELMMSTQILTVGKNTYMWCLAGDKIPGYSIGQDFLSDMLGYKDKQIKSASQVLAHSQFRTSTKAHDKVFALANIFHDIGFLDVDYDNNVHIAMKSFYRQLAERDLSVMCFGSPLPPSGKSVFTPTMNSYGLPSWTGVYGYHSSRPVADILLGQNGNYHIDDEMRLHLNCRSYTIHPMKYINNGMFNSKDRTQMANFHYQKTIVSMDHFNSDESAALDWSQWCMHKATTDTATHYWKPHQPPGSCFPVLPLSLTEDCLECVIPEVLFNIVEQSSYKSEGDNFNGTYNYHYLSPVLTKSGGSATHKVIGFILLKHFLHNEARQDPHEFLERIFSNYCEESKSFVIV